MYRGDSLFTLSHGGVAGVLALSLVLALWLLWLNRRLGRGRGRVLRLAQAAGLFWLFVWLSPQLYYLYYQTIIPGLPWQLVVGAPPGGERLLRLLLFADGWSLSDHGKGVLGWLLALQALRPRR